MKKIIIGLLCAMLLLNAMAAIAEGAVSYTHLDVYKRQDHQRGHGKEIRGIGTEPVGAPVAARLPRFHIERNNRGSNAGIQKQHRKIEQAVRRNIGVVFHARAKVT